MTFHFAGQYLRLQGSQQEIVDHANAESIKLDHLKRPNVALADFTTSAPPPQYTPVQSDGEEEAMGSRRGPLHTGWDPPFLRPLVLLAFALLFLLFFVSLQIIWSWSQAHQGIATSDDSKHYLWTFGPTAVLVVVTVGWRQVDYAAKSIQPWAEMARGPATADRSLLLDYVTPFQAIALLRALRNRHFVVASTITTFALLKVLTIVSTGLFSLDDVTRNGTGVVMQPSSSFSGKNFNSAAFVDSRPAYVVYGVQHLNLSYPSGTSAEHAVQLFTAQDQPLRDAVSHTAVADVFSAALDCELNGHLTYTDAFDYDPINGFVENTPVSAFYNTSVATSTCQIHNAHLDTPQWEDNSTHFGYYGLMQNVTCSNLAEDDPARNRVMFALAYSKSPSLNEQTILNSSTAVCIPTYTIQSAFVTLSGTNDVQTVRLTSESSRQLPGVSGYDIAMGVLTSTEQASLIDSAGSESNYNIKYDVFFDLMAASTSNSAAHDLLDVNMLESAAQRTYSKIAAQIASRYLFINEAKTSSSAQASTLAGSVLQVEHRLLARQLPLRLMQGIAILMFCLVTLMLFIMQRGVIPRSPDSLVAIAAVMARSPSVTRQLTDSGHIDLDRLRRLLSSQRFCTIIREGGDAPVFSVQASGGQMPHDEVPYMKELDVSPVRWVQPFSLGYLAKILAVIGPIAVIVTLEVTLRLSNANSGLATVTADTSTRYAWLYAPTLALVLLGTLFNVLDFDIEFAEPYHRLSRGYTDAKSSMFQDHLRRIPIFTTFHALINRRYALLAASISILLAPTLTIISSGLFTVQSVPSTNFLDEARVVDWFNTTGTFESSQDPSAGLVTSLIVQSNMSYPAWTYDELVLPQIALGINSTSVGAYNGTATVKIPALRGDMGCIVVSEERYYNPVVGTAGAPQINISASNGCGNGENAQGTSYISTNLDVPITGYFGNTLQLGSGNGCASLVLFYGQVVNNITTHFTTLACTPYLDRVEVNVTFNVPELSISASPLVLPNTTSLFSTWSAEFPNMDFQAINVSTSSNVFDGFFDAIVWGKDGIPAAELTDPNTLLDAVNHVYRQLVAQTLNIDFRSSISDLPANQTDIPAKLAASYTSPNRTRLVQSTLSTRLLQGVLVVLLLCAVIVFLLIDMRKVLPKPVGSIGAVASLLAGSRLLDEKEGLIPPGAEWWSDRQWQQRGIWKGEEFRMGWWDAAGVLGAAAVDGRKFRIDVRPRARGGWSTV